MLSPDQTPQPAPDLPSTDLPPEEALAQLKAQLQLLEERARAKVVARPLRGLVRLANADAQRIGRGGLRGAVLLGIAAVAGMTAYVCAVVAAVIWLGRLIDPVLATALVALAFGALTVTALGLAAAVYRRERRWLGARAVIYQDAGTVLLRAVLGPRLMALVTAMGEPGPREDPPAPPQPDRP